MNGCGSDDWPGVQYEAEFERQLNVKEWCREQCIRQHATTPRDFLGMEYAWGYAKTVEDNPVTIQNIKRIAEYVDSAANPGGRFRTGPAVFMDGGTAAPAQDIETRLVSLLSWLNDEDPFADRPSTATPEEFYRELMYIHPFKDGNGRVGALVYNWLNGTLDGPVNPPEYK